MGIQVKGDNNAGVAQVFANRLGGLTSDEAQGCEGVAQTVEGQVGQIIWFGEGLLHKSNI